MLQFLRRSQRYFCIVGMFLICAAHAAHAVGDLHANPNQQRWLQLADTTFQHFGKDKGMQYATTALVEDADGFLWLGTQGGLARWDGYRFRFYRPNPNDPHALPDNYILNLHTDQQGRLWVGTSNGGVARYEPESDHFTVFRP